MAKKNITLIFPFLGEEHLGKDAFLVPYYLGKMNNLFVDILCSPNREMDSSFREINIIQIPFKNNNLIKFYTCKNVLKYLFFNAKKINVLMEFHVNIYVLLSLFFYKKRNNKGLSFLKADGGDLLLKLKDLSLIKRTIFKFLIKRVDVISIETKELYDQIDCIKTQIPIKRLLYIPNGFDEYYMQDLDIKPKVIKEKENIVITVGRLGSFQKNTELLLEVAKKIEWRDWKLILIGPIETKEQDFQKYIDLFFIENPNMIDKIIFAGPIYDKKELWEIYNKTKVFVLTSRFESSGIVLNEANRFSNYILSTNVGCAKDVICSNNYGQIVEDKDVLIEAIQAIISGDIDLNVKYMQKNNFDMSWDNFLKELSGIIKKN